MGIPQGLALLSFSARSDGAATAAGRGAAWARSSANLGDSESLANFLRKSVRNLGVSRDGFNCAVIRIAPQ